MIGRNIVETTVRSSAATNTLKPTTARIHAGDGTRAARPGRVARSCIAADLRVADVGRRLDRELVAEVVELERPLGRAGFHRGVEPRRRHEERVRVDPQVDVDVLALYEPDGDVAHLFGGCGAGDVVTIATLVLDA